MPESTPEIIMKKLTQTSVLALLAAALLLGSATQSQAHPNGYWDRGGRWHDYGYYHHHQGYWDERNGGRVWINIGI